MGTQVNSYFPENSSFCLWTSKHTNTATAVAEMDSLPRQALLHALQKVRAGDFSVRLPGDLTGIEGKIADTFNDIVMANERMAAELKRVGLAVGKKGPNQSTRAVPATRRRVGRYGGLHQRVD
jgi:hypothetical protein